MSAFFVRPTLSVSCDISEVAGQVRSEFYVACDACTNRTQRHDNEHSARTEAGDTYVCFVVAQRLEVTLCKPCVLLRLHRHVNAMEDC